MRNRGLRCLWRRPRCPAGVKTQRNELSRLDNCLSEGNGLAWP